MILETRDDRIKLLKAGFTGKQIEALFFVVNHFEAVGVAWQDEERDKTKYFIEAFRPAEVNT
jgi:hypothetical protein